MIVLTGEFYSVRMFISDPNLKKNGSGSDQNARIRIGNYEFTIIVQNAIVTATSTLDREDENIKEANFFQFTINARKKVICLCLSDQTRDGNYKAQFMISCASKLSRPTN